MSETTSTVGRVPIPQTPNDSDYREFERLIASRVAAARGPLFTTDASGLFEAYLAGIPGETTFDADGLKSWYVHSGPRKHYDCRCCRRFIEKYGGLVTIAEDGSISPTLWFPSGMTKVEAVTAIPGSFHKSVGGMMGKIGVAKVTGVFVNGEATWGTPCNSPGPGSKYQGQRWTHLHGEPKLLPKMLNTATHSPDQKAAELKQDYITLKRALSEIPMEAAVQVVRVLEANAVDRSEKTLGVAKWFLDLHQRIAPTGNGYGGGREAGMRRDNLIWLAVATAPPGFCHIRSSMIGTLLEDVIAGMDFDSIKRRWDAKMHPLRYQRPQAEPSEQEIVAANKLMAKLGAEGALERRYARLTDVLKFEWRSYESLPEDHKRNWGGAFSERYGAGLENKPRGGGAFDSLLKKKQEVKTVELPPKSITWAKFRDEVLSRAKTLEVMLVERERGTAFGSRGMSFYGLVTATNPDSPPMLQWDGLYSHDLEQTTEAVLPVGIKLLRNPVSWYFYNGDSIPQQWGLEPGWTRVGAVFLFPHQWQQPERVGHQGRGVMLAIPEARDQREPGGGYFPEMLRSEFHGIRGVIEAHSRSVKLVGKDEGDANGVALVKGGTLTVRVDGGDSYILSLGDEA